MVVKEDGLFRCEECGLRYEKRRDAVKCERFCTDHGACNSAIIKKSVEMRD